MWLLECPKTPISEHPSTVNVLTGTEHCWYDHANTFITPFHWSIDFRSRLVRSEILGQFGNTLTADHLYSGREKEKTSATFSTAMISETENILSNF